MANDPIGDASQRFHWKPQPDAWRLVRELVSAFCQTNEFARQLQSSMRDETGTRMVDWVDHLSVPATWQFGDQRLETRLYECGYRQQSQPDSCGYVHDAGLFPRIQICNTDDFHLAIQVESVSDFLLAHQLETEITGSSGSRFRRSLVSRQSGHVSHPSDAANDNFATELHVCERHGWNAWHPCDASEQEIQVAAGVLAKFRSRPREHFSDEKSLIQSAVKMVGVDWACDLFFAAEREFWQSRNHAARVQYERQNKLGLGWGNHDHHTYRNSRENFSNLIGCLESLGFHCRERFYAGGQAGWGAQVLEQSSTGIVIFADVDLSPEELSGDFSHEGLSANKQVGTVGLWCHLHGEAFLQAGMHHLECQFDFDAARSQLAKAGIETMQPFTDFDYLKQAFTRGEVWQVDAAHIERALQHGWISSEQAETFRRDGCVGSHLEILERNDGFKGFNQTGVSEIIRKTDPRLLRSGDVSDGAAES